MEEPSCEGQEQRIIGHIRGRIGDGWMATRREARRNAGANAVAAAGRLPAVMLVATAVASHGLDRRRPIAGDVLASPRLSLSLSLRG